MCLESDEMPSWDEIGPLRPKEGLLRATQGLSGQQQVNIRPKKTLSTQTGFFQADKGLSRADYGPTRPTQGTLGPTKSLFRPNEGSLSVGRAFSRPERAHTPPEGAL